MVNGLYLYRAFLVFQLLKAIPYQRWFWTDRLTLGKPFLLSLHCIWKGKCHWGRTWTKWKRYVLTNPRLVTNRICLTLMTHTGRSRRLHLTLSLHWRGLPETGGAQARCWPTPSSVSQPTSHVYCQPTGYTYQYQQSCLHPFQTPPIFPSKYLPVTYPIHCYCLPYWYCILVHGFFKHNMMSDFGYQTCLYV